MKVCNNNHTEIVYDESISSTGWPTTTERPSICPCCVLVKEDERKHKEDVLAITRASYKPLLFLQTKIDQYEKLLDAALNLCNGMGFEFLNSTEKHMMMRLSKACANMNR